ncbi:MAG: hypothetical protein ACE5GN_01425 [Waddliaceae bacterium]
MPITSIQPVSSKGLQPSTPPEKQASSSAPQALFEKIVLKANKGLPTDQNGNPIDLRGCVAITQDAKHQGWLHKVMWLAQRIHTFILGRWKCDSTFCHGMIILDRDRTGRKGKEDNLIVAHSVLDGIHTSSCNYLKEKHVTGLVVYRPVDPKLRELLIKHGNRTAYTDPRFQTDPSATDYKVQKAGFSFFDFISSCFRNLFSAPSNITKKHTARIVADLLMDNQILDSKGKKPHAFFCMPYVMSVLQGSMLIQALSDEDKKALLVDEQGKPKSRKALAKAIYSKIKKKDNADALSRAYWDSKICQQNARYITSCYAAKELDKVSTPFAVVQS